MDIMGLFLFGYLFSIRRSLSLSLLSRSRQDYSHAYEPHGSCGSRPKSLGGGSGRRPVRRQTGFITTLGALYWLVRLARAAPSTASSGYACAGPSRAG